MMAEVEAESHPEADQEVPLDVEPRDHPKKVGW